MLFLLLSAGALIIWLEAPGLIKKQMWRELAAFAVFLAVGLALAIPQLYGIKLFDPNAPVETLFRPIGEWLKEGLY